MQAQQAILTFNEADRSLGARLLKIAIEIDRVEGYSEPHAIAIAWTAEKIGTRMGLHGIDLTALKFAALAHDLGERAMKRDYLLQPSELSWEETLDLWRHPILGEQAAGELKLPRQTQLLIRWHHEWWNGGGYPDGLAGEAIPPGARILRAVDSYFALISDRPHRRRFDRVEAEQIIADLAGIEFDPQVTKLLLQVLAEEVVSEGAFVYPAPDGDEAVTSPIEDQRQPIDEVIYASTYATRKEEIPAESLSGGQSSAPGAHSLIPAHQAPNIVPDEDLEEAITESLPVLSGVILAPSEPADEGDDGTRAEAPGGDFAPQSAIGEAVIESRLEMRDDDIILSESPEEITFHGQIEMDSLDLAPLNAPDMPDMPDMFDATEIESRTTGPLIDFASLEPHGEAGDDVQLEIAGVEPPKPQAKKEEIES
jgi:hypothetical protein